MDIRPVEICALVWWVQIWDLWFHPPCLCATQKRWTDGFFMHGFHHEAWRRRCDGVGVLCWWHCWECIQNWRHTEPAWLPQHPAATCHPIRFAFWLDHHLFFNMTMTPKHSSRLCKGYLTKKESDGVLRQMTRPSQPPDLNPIEMFFLMRWTTEWRQKGQQVLSISGNSFKIVGKPFQVTTSWSSSRECQECAKQ